VKTSRRGGFSSGSSTAAIVEGPSSFLDDFVRVKSGVKTSRRVGFSSGSSTAAIVEGPSSFLDDFVRVKSGVKNSHVTMSTSILTNWSHCSFSTNCLPNQRRDLHD
jgi:hypothetical protein